MGKCRRATWFRWLQSNQDFTSEFNHYEPVLKELKEKTLVTDIYMQWVWRAGELYEEHMINLAKESGVFIATQVPVFMPSLPLSGKLDLITINPVTHKYSIAEVKSVYGHGGNYTLGTPGARNKGELGTPRESNLMQIALYDWWFASKDDAYEYSRLIYGARDTGRYAEYGIYTKDNESKETEIYYFGIAPNVTPPTKSPITINNILTQFKYVDDCLKSSTIPDRDYQLVYSQEKIQELYETKQLGKTDTERYEKYQKYLSGESKRKIKPVTKGDWNCDRCNFKNICYKSTSEDDPDYGVPRDL